MPRNFVPSLIPSNSQASGAWWFIFSGYRLPVEISDRKAAIPVVGEPEDIGVTVTRTLYLGSFRGHPCYAAEGAGNNEKSSGAVFRELRSLLDSLEARWFKADALPNMSGKLSIARELIDWLATKHSLTNICNHDDIGIL
jgi:NADH pyrophosphatase NudC (nudix superfamily)